MFERGIRVPRECPLCGHGFWIDDGHVQRPLSPVQKATMEFERHDSRAHGGLLLRLARWFS